MTAQALLRRLQQQSKQPTEFKTLPTIVKILANLRTGTGAVALPNHWQKVTLQFPKEERTSEDASSLSTTEEAENESVVSGIQTFWKECLPRLAYNNRHVEFSVIQKEHNSTLADSAAGKVSDNAQLTAAFHVDDVNGNTLETAFPSDIKNVEEILVKLLELQGPGNANVVPSAAPSADAKSMANKTP